jgi:zinc transporter ZupT
MTILEYALIIAMPVLGGLAALALRRQSPSRLQLLLSFSGAYLIGITFLSLIPDLYAHYSLKIGALIIAGFVLQIVLDQFSRGVEHGHMHAEEHSNKWFVVSLLIGLGVHSFLEGIPLSTAADIGEHTSHTHQPLLFGIAIHKLPAAFALATVVLFTGASNARAMMVVGLYALITPLGALSAEVFYEANWFSVASSMDLVMAVVIGSFLHISTTILFEVGGKAHTFKLLRLIAVLVGAGAAIVTVA